MNIKRVLAGVLSATLLLSSITACAASGSSGGAASTAGSASAPVKLTFSFWDNPATSTDLMTKLYDQGIKTFNASHKDIQVEMQSTTMAEYYSKLNTQAAANTMPDLIMTSGAGKMKTYVDANKYIDMSSYLDKDANWKNSFTASSFSLVKFNNKVYGIPLNQAAGCVFYNTEIFKKNNIAVPTTWTEFLSACATIKKTGVYPLAISGKDTWAIAILSAYLSNRLGGNDPLQKISDGAGDWNDPSFVQAGEKVKELYDKGYVQPSSLGDSEDQATAFMKSGQASMMVMGSWLIGQLNASDSKVKGKVGVFTFPKVEDGKGDANMWLSKTDNIAISSSCKNPDAGITFLKYLTSDEFQKQTAETAGKIPVTNVKVDLAKAPKEFGFISDSMKTSTGMFTFYDEALGAKIGDEYNNTMGAIVSGTKSSKDSFAELQKYTQSNR